MIVLLKSFLYEMLWGNLVTGLYYFERKVNVGESKIESWPLKFGDFSITVFGKSDSRNIEYWGEISKIKCKSYKYLSNTKFNVWSWRKIVRFSNFDMARFCLFFLVLFISEVAGKTLI